MKIKKLIILITLIVITACANKQTKSQVFTGLQKNEKKGANTTHKASSKQFNSKLDSIDFTNNQTIINDEEYINKVVVSLSDSTIFLTANMKLDHRIFGYSKPNTQSKKLLLLSIFTNDVENNPFKCELGAYYDTNRMENMDLKFIQSIKDFVEVTVFDHNSNKVTTVYFEKRFIEFYE